MLRDSDHPEQYAQAVRWMCLHLTSYDHQSEGGRGWYLYQAMRLTGQADSIEADVRQRLARCRPGGWFSHQLGDILLHCARDHSPTARQALWDYYTVQMRRLARTIRRDQWWPDDPLEGLSDDLVSLDGWSAARTIISDYGQALELGRVDAERARWQYFPNFFDQTIRETFGDNAVDDYLASAALPGLDAYGEVAAVYRTKPWRGTGQASGRGSTETMTMDDLRTLVARSRTSGQTKTMTVRSAAVRIARQGAEQQEDLARLGLAETDPTLKAQLLWPFTIRAFPVPSDALDELVDTENETLRRVVRRILGQQPAEWKRHHALALLWENEQTGQALHLLGASYQPEDEAAVDAAVRRVSVLRRTDAWHEAFWALRDLLEPDDRPVTTTILEYVYRETHCAVCRLSTVELMRDKGILTSEISQECQWDSYEFTRSSSWGSESPVSEEK